MLPWEQSFKQSFVPIHQRFLFLEGLMKEHTWSSHVDMLTSCSTTAGFAQRAQATAAEFLFALLRMRSVHKSRNSCSGTLRLQLSVTHRKCCQIQHDCKLLQQKMCLFSNEVAINDQLISS